MAARRAHDSNCQRHSLAPKGLTLRARARSPAWAVCSAAPWAAPLADAVHNRHLHRYSAPKGEHSVFENMQHRLACWRQAMQAALQSASSPSQADGPDVCGGLRGLTARTLAEVVGHGAVVAAQHLLDHQAALVAQQVHRRQGRQRHEHEREEDRACAVHAAAMMRWRWQFLQKK